MTPAQIMDAWFSRRPRLVMALYDAQTDGHVTKAEHAQVMAGIAAAEEEHNQAHRSRTMRQQRRTRTQPRFGTCAACGAEGCVELDHVKAIAEGGADDEANLQSLCIPCHRAKTKKHAGLRAERDRILANLLVRGCMCAYGEGGQP